MRTCRHCGKLIVESRGRWWSDDDEDICPDGRTPHEPGHAWHTRAALRMSRLRRPARRDQGDQLDAAVTGR